MMLTAGTRLGSYDVVALIGSGGMGEVYQAHDTKLGRDVAIKVLPEAFAHDPQRLSRFQREAKVLASLNHPGTCTINEIGKAEGHSFIVMVFLDGETLKHRIRGKPLELDAVHDLGVQVADALDAAHAEGFVHRRPNEDSTAP